VILPRDLTTSSTYLLFCSAIRLYHWFQCFHSQVILHLIFGWELPVSAVNFGFVLVKIGEGIFGFRPEHNQFFLLSFRTPKVPAKFREDWLKNATVGVSITDRHTDRQTHT